jgi:copper transport protein
MLVVGTVAAIALIAPSPAFAHASLVSTSPIRGAVLEDVPDRVLLRFDEGVSTVAGSVRVYDDQARRVDSGDIDRPSSSEVAVSLPDALRDGTYTVAWRVLSADSHPVRGAFVFSVGTPSGSGSGVASQVLDLQSESTAVDLALWLVRFVGLASILLCVGGAAVAAFVAEPDGWRTRRPWLALAGCAVLLAVDTLAWIALTGVKVAGLGLGAVLRWSLARDVLDTGFGRIWLLRVLLALALAALALCAARRPSERWLVPIVLVASTIAVTPALSGHARVEGAIAVAADAVHVAAAGVWVGGLAFVALLLVEAGGDRWPLAGAVVPRFSRLALWSVVALVAAGVLSGFLEVRSWQALWHTTYGQLLLVKVALLTPLVALGAFNNRVSVPVLRSGGTTRPARRRFVRAVAAELVLMVAVVGVTAALVAEPPAKAAVVAGPASRDGRVGPFDYSLVVDPARAGSNEIHVYVLDTSGAPARVDEITVSATLPAASIGPLRMEMTAAGPGHAVATAAELPLAGDWRLELSVRRGEFDSWSTYVDIPIGKE